MAGRKSSGYQWDLFISYPRRSGIRRWVAEVFHPQIEEDLQNVGLGRPVHIFRDQEEIEAGDIWPNRLSDEHARSRIILAVLCFSYFESPWCCSEWKTAAARDGKGSHACIIPVRFNDLERETIATLPNAWRSDVGKRESFDLGKYSGLVNRLADIELALDFRTKIAGFCERVLKPAIDSAPAWKSAWPRMPTDPAIRTRPAFRARLGPVR